LAVAVVVTNAKRGEEDERREVQILRWGGHPWLGISIADVTAEKARELKLAGPAGALITDVEEESPAAKAGLTANDVVVEFAGERVRSAAQLSRLVRETPSGATVTMQVNRAGETRTLSVTPEGRRAHFRMPRIHVPPPQIHVPDIEIPEFNVHVFRRGARLGISADQLTTQLADYFGVPSGKGVLVREVVAGSAAEKAGLKAGDVIVRVDEETITSVSGLRRALAGGGEESREVTLTIVRERREQTVKVQLEEKRPFGPRRSARVVVGPGGPGEPEWLWGEPEDELIWLEEDIDKTIEHEIEREMERREPETEPLGDRVRRWAEARRGRV
jgi:serine protease Do